MLNDHHAGKKAGSESDSQGDESTTKLALAPLFDFFLFLTIAVKVPICLIKNTGIPI
jgi:hypothetical protein